MKLQRVRKEIIKVAVRSAANAPVMKTKSKKSNFVYGCGNGRTGSLFIRQLRENSLDCSSPQQIAYFNSRNICSIAAGFGFSVFASKRRLYGGGVNIFSSDVGSVDYWTKGICLNAFGRGEYFSAISSVAAGRRHFLVNTGDAVYAFGDNLHGQCGQNPARVPYVRLEDRPYKKIEIPSHSKVAQVHCSLDTSFILLESGKLFSFGLGIDGQLGRGFQTFDWQCLPVEGDLEQVQVRLLKGSTDTLMALSSAGELFMWGQNEYHQMYPFVSEMQSFYPKEIRFSKKKLVGADSTATSCVTLTDAGEVLVWGSSILGMGPCVMSLLRPAQLDSNLFSGGPNDFGKVKKIFAGNTSVFAISEFDNLFSWGINRFSHLGLAHESDQYFPYQLPTLKKPIDVSIAPDHALFIFR